jgi:hypothetical protein
VSVGAREQKLLESIARISAQLPPGWPFGLEHDLIRRGFGALPIVPAAIRHPVGAGIVYLDDPKRDHLLRRPPAEVAARALWDRLAAGPLRLDDLLSAAGSLGGEPRLRTRPARTTAFASGHVLEYAAPDRVPARLERLLGRVNAAAPALHPLLHAVGIYQECLLIHPLPDGNGRLARLLFQVSLHRTLGLRAPVFPLGPACAANRPALIAAYLAWEFDGEAGPLVDLIAAALEQLAALYARTARRKPQDPQP